MQKIFISLLSFVLFTYTTPALGSSDRLDLAITPIKKELTLDPGSITTGSVTLYNNSDISYPAQMGAEDCTSSNQFGTPKCTPHNGVGDPLYLSTWIEFASTGAFSIPPHSSRTVSYTIRAPLGAQPGGHYAGLIFRNLNPPTGGTIGIKRQMQSLILVTITGEMTVNPVFGSLLIDGHGGGAGGGSPVTPFRDFFKWDDTRPLLDQTKDKGAKLLKNFGDPVFQKDILDVVNPFWEIPSLNSAPNTVAGVDNKKSPILSISIPVENNGTIHITPTGQVKLYELDGTELKNIGKEYIKNEFGAAIGEVAVDYIPINSEGGSALPGSDRTYEVNWFGFAREIIDMNKNVAVVYETPGEYYSRLARENSEYLFPWEKLIAKNISKQLISKVSISYINPLTKATIDSTQDIPVTVEYDEIVKVFNTGIFTPIVIFGILIGWTMIWRSRRYIYPEIIDDEITVLERARASLIHQSPQVKKSKTGDKKQEEIKKVPIKKASTRTPRVKKISPETTPENI